MSNERPRRDFMKQFAVTTAMALPAVALADASAKDKQTPAAKDSHPCPFFTITEFGAVGDGKTLCTAAIQKTVDACAQAGGGKIIVPAGRYLTGPIFLKSNINVEVVAGGVLAFTTDIDSVPSIQGRWEGIDRVVYASLFTGLDLENVSITGHGTLDGQGETWWKAHRVVHEMRKKMGLEEREPENPAGAPLKWGRPRMINLYRCKNVLVSGLKIVNSPSWNIHPVNCKNTVIDGVTITAPDNSPNTDGIDPDSCKDLRISNCYISVGDDCIVIKSGYRYQAHGIPSENITVTNCVFGKGHCGVGIGSETSGGVSNIAISNCICDGTDRGLRFKTARGRGRAVENIRATNVVMRDVGEAIAVTMFYAGGDKHAPQPVNEQTPAFRNFHFSDIIVNGGRQAALIEGLPEMPIKGISLSNIVVNGCATGMTCTNANGVTFDNVVVNPEKGPALSVDGVRDLEIYRCTTHKPNSGEPVLHLENVNNAVVQSCTASEGTGTFLELKGSANSDISLLLNRLTCAAKEVSLTDGATQAAIVKRT